MATHIASDLMSSSQPYTIFYDAKSIKKSKIPMGTAAQHYHYKLRRWSLWNYCKMYVQGVMKADDIKSIGKKNYTSGYGGWGKCERSSMSLGKKWKWNFNKEKKKINLIKGKIYGKFKEL